MILSPIAEHHRTRGFRSDSRRLDRYLQRARAFPFGTAGVVTLVATQTAGDSRVLGYYTLAPARFRMRASAMLGEGTDYAGVMLTHLAANRYADVDTVRALLLRDALHRFLRAAQRGERFAAVAAYAPEPDVGTFLQTYAFQPWAGAAGRYFLTMNVVRNSFTLARERREGSDWHGWT